jgi:uncharacterized sulfatase
MNMFWFMNRAGTQLERAFQAVTPAFLMVIILTMNTVAAEARRPNFLVITLEDVSASRLGCYGDALARTPTMDALARAGVHYTQAFAAAPVCAPSRCTLITGVEAASLGGIHMRCNIQLPPKVKCFTEYLREAGYYCVNAGKQDYQFVAPAASWDAQGDKAHWRKRPRPDQPFYAVFNFVETHQGSIRDGGYAKLGGRLSADQRTDPARVRVPAFLPDTPIVRRDIARRYDNVAVADGHLARLLGEIEADGLVSNTIVIVFSDHGDGGLPRFKEYPYDTGLRVPFIIRVPEGMVVPGFPGKGVGDSQLITFSDFAPTILNLAGVKIPSHFQGRAFLGPNLKPPREFVVGTRDRGNDRYETIRAVSDGRWLYVRHFQPWRPLMQPMCGFEGDTSLQELNRAAAEGKLPPLAEQFMTPTQPVEELFDSVADPDNVINLAAKPEHNPVLDKMRQRLAKQIARIGDLGFLPEGLLKDFAAGGISERAIGMGQGGKYNATEAAHWASLGQLAPFSLAEARQGLTSADPVAQYWSAIAVATQANELPGDSPVKPELLALLKSPHGDVQAAAAFALAKTGLDFAAAKTGFCAVLQGKRMYATLNALNLIDLLPRRMAQELRPEIERLAKIKYASTAAAERYVHDLAVVMLKGM